MTSNAFVGKCKKREKMYHNSLVWNSQLPKRHISPITTSSSPSWKSLWPRKKMVVVVARLVVLYGREEMGNSFQSLEPLGYQVMYYMLYEFVECTTRGLLLVLSVLLLFHFLKKAHAKMLYTYFHKKLFINKKAICQESFLSGYLNY